MHKKFRRHFRQKSLFSPPIFIAALAALALIIALSKLVGCGAAKPAPMQGADFEYDQSRIVSTLSPLFAPDGVRITDCTLGEGEFTLGAQCDCDKLLKNGALPANFSDTVGTKACLLSGKLEGQDGEVKATALTLKIGALRRELDSADAEAFNVLVREFVTAICKNNGFTYDGLELRSGTLIIHGK